MKYEFKIGQWFDIRKFTDWQRQWCLGNLNFLSPSEADFEGRSFNLWLYSEWTGLGYLFGSASEHCCDSENEITFNDFYWGEDEIKPVKESVFNNPKWVTCCNDSLGQVTIGKDYKVVNVNDDNYTIIMDSGIEGSLHKDRFHKVTLQDLLPNKCKDDEASFDNLVYVEPKEDVSILYNTLSSEQLSFLLNNLTFNTIYGHNESDATHLSYDSDDRVWFTEISKPDLKDKVITFNHIFQEVN